MTDRDIQRRIAIVSFGYGWLPCEPGPSRFYDIAQQFVQAGWNVDFIISGFQHFNKAPRDRELIESQGYPFEVTIIDVPPYRKNIDVRRIYSNRIGSRRVVSYLRTQRYDAVYCSIPANDIAAAVGEWCHREGIPFIVDIEDLWPEAMAMLDIAPPLTGPVYGYFQHDAERVYRVADAVVGTSEDYTARAMRNNGRLIPAMTVYVGCNLVEFDEGAARHADRIMKPAGEFWVTYAGNIGTSYDIETLVRSAAVLRDCGIRDIRVKILGDGPLRPELEDLASELGCDNVEFLGYRDYDEMAAYLVASDLLVNSFVSAAPQSFVNKVGDYLAAGKPIINTLENPVFQSFVHEQGVGVNIEPGNVAALAGTIIAYQDNPEQWDIIGRRARLVCEAHFDRKATYPRIVSFVEGIVKGHEARS